MEGRKRRRFGRREDEAPRMESRQARRGPESPPRKLLTVKTQSNYKDGFTKREEELENLPLLRKDEGISQSGFVPVGRKTPADERTGRKRLSFDGEKAAILYISPSL